MADVSIDPTCNNPKELEGQGIRAFVLQDYEVAVAAFSKASELLVSEHGSDTHDSLADVYLYYGKALLGLSREQNEALGDAVPKNPEDDSDEDDEGIKTGDSEDGATNEETEDKTDKAQPANEEPSTSTVDNGEDPSKSKDDDSIDAGKEDDEPTDLQVAWEVLELAKKIYQRRGEDAKKNLADTLIVLGEVGLESESFDSAISDIKEGLEIQKILFGDDSRAIAETYYKLGMAYSTNSQIDEANQCFEKSLEYLRSRITSLEKMEDTVAHMEEIDEIKGLIPDIEEKISDMKNYKEEAIKKISEAVNGSSKVTSESATSSTQANDISHLVKRKKKSDDNAEVPSKKPAP